MRNGGLNKFPIADTFGWFQNFIIALKAELEIHAAEKSISLNFGIFKCCTKVEKNKFSILAFPSLVVIILSLCTTLLFFKNQEILFEAGCS